MFRPCRRCGCDTKQRCAKCKKSYYCSRECQVADWPRHRRNECTARRIKCASCTRSDAPHACHECGVKRYCSREHAEQDWRLGHASECRPDRNLPAEILDEVCRWVPNVRDLAALGATCRAFHQIVATHVRGEYDLPLKMAPRLNHTSSYVQRAHSIDSTSIGSHSLGFLEQCSPFRLHVDSIEGDRIPQNVRHFIVRGVITLVNGWKTPELESFCGNAFTVTRLAEIYIPPKLQHLDLTTVADTDSFDKALVHFTALRSIVWRDVDFRAFRIPKFNNTNVREIYIVSKHTLRYKTQDPRIALEWRDDIYICNQIVGGPGLCLRCPEMTHAHAHCACPAISPVPEGYTSGSIKKRNVRPKISRPPKVYDDINKQSSLWKNTVVDLLSIHVEPYEWYLTYQ